MRNANAGGIKSDIEKLADCATEDDAIGLLVSVNLGPIVKENLFRVWCRQNHVDVRRGALERLKKGRRREMQRPLVW